MNLQETKDSIKDYAKDMKLNLGAVLTSDGAPELSQMQIFGTALACAYSLKNQKLVDMLLQEGTGHLTDQDIFGAKAAATLMAMNNVYYRFTHLAEDGVIGSLPARLRMNVIGAPQTDKKSFELFCLAVSAINGCGSCIKAHVKELRKAGMSDVGIQSGVRIGAVIAAVAQAQFID